MKYHLHLAAPHSSHFVAPCSQQAVWYSGKSTGLRAGGPGLTHISAVHQLCGLSLGCVICEQEQ